VQVELEQFKETTPQEFEELENTVAAIKTAANLEFDWQLPEVQQV
jgi:hypothetical protein